MSDFVWTEEFTVDALSNLEHGTWAIFNPQDIFRAIEQIQQGGGKATKLEFDQIRMDLGVDFYDFRDILVNLELLTKSDGSWHLTDKPSRPGFYSGKELAASIEDCGIDNSWNLNILGHNFTLNARESLRFCYYLMDPGVSKDYLRTELENHYVFNQKLNPFKFENLLRILKKLEVIEETEHGFIVIKYAPPTLTFYNIVSEYFNLVSNKVGSKVDASDLQREVHSLIPNRSEDYTVLGFKKFPIEGWGRYQVWMTSESFERFLSVGLIDPLHIARILKTIVKDRGNPSQDLAQSTLKRLGMKISDDVKSFRGKDGEESPPINLPEVLREYEVPD